MGEEEFYEEMEIENLPSMWPEGLEKDAGKKFNVERPGADQDMLQEVDITDEQSMVDFQRLVELTNYSEKGSSQLAYLVKQWEYKQANVVRLLNEEIDNLSRQRKEAELKQLEILEAFQFEEEKHAGDKRSISILEEEYDIWGAEPRRKKDVVFLNSLDVEAEYDTINYWKQRAFQLEKMLQASLQREQILEEKLQDNIKNLEKQSSPVEELSQILERADNYLHFVLQNAPVVIGHLDKEMRYRFIYNHFPSLDEEDIIGKTDVEIFSGAGVKESQDFKREVMERGVPAKREITFDTELFGSKTFLIHVEPVFSKSGETIGVNYMGMDVTDQVIKREKMAKIREEIAVQKAKETELNKTIHLTEETMRAKQVLATMSHEIRSPLSGVVSMAEILANTKLDHEQRQLLDVMLSSGDLVLQLINDILDLSKVESGVMKLEATKFRPREVVRHVLQTAAASLQKKLSLDGLVASEVPVEIIGDVLRIRQILTNLISNAVKFTHEGKVGIRLHVVPRQHIELGNWHQSFNSCQEGIGENSSTVKASPNQSRDDLDLCCDTENEEITSTKMSGLMMNENTEVHHTPYNEMVWLRCDVYDTGIGIPEKALPTLFKKYMQVRADHARKYGGTGLGLAICKQLVELMGGHLTVTSQENHGSTFSFVMPCKVSPKPDPSDDLEEARVNESMSDDYAECDSDAYFSFQPSARGSISVGVGSMPRIKQLSSGNTAIDEFDDLQVTSASSRESLSMDSYCSVADTTEASSENECCTKDKVNVDNKVFNGRGESQRGNTNGLVMSRYQGPALCGSNSHTVENTQNGHKASKENCNPLAKSSSEERSSEVSNSGEKTHQCPPQLTKPICQPKILLVEDNKINIMVTQSMMKQIGHAIDVVNNGLEAICAVQTRHYDLVLMDVCMPVMDGLQATRLIRSFEENGNWDALREAGIELDSTCINEEKSDHIASTLRRHIPIIAMTANALAESAAECLANGMDSFVSKPVTFQKLKQCLQQYLPQC